MRYLSPDWIEAADAAVRDAAATAPTPGVVVDQHVDGVTGYRVTVDRHRSSLVAIDPADSGGVADAVFHQSESTARAIAQGTTDAHQAFLLGHLRFEGDIEILIERRQAFDWLAQVLAPLMARTTFD
jgi:hypothetical protein